MARKRCNTFAHSARLLAIAAIALAIGGSATDPGTAAADAETSGAVTVIYDVSDLVRPLAHFPAPRLGLEGLEPAPLAADAEAEDRGARWTTEKLAEVVRELVLRDEVEDGRASVIPHDGILIVTVLPPGQRAVTSFLNTLDDRISLSFAVYRAEESALVRLGLGAGARTSRIELETAAAAKVLAELAADRDCAPLASRELALVPGRWAGVAEVPRKASKRAAKSQAARAAAGERTPRFQFRALPIASGDAIEVEWKIEASPAAEGAESGGEPAGPLETGASGKEALPLGKVVILRGFTGPGAENGGNMLFVLRAEVVKRR
ncbi:MAG: hypothetical protein L0Z55_00560 [Planctomycetes bacterium]|nr:hypothetical protein [Planctomycetota bacterium]